MRSFLFIGDPQDKIAEWLEGEHKVLLIAPSENHDSTARALATLKTAGLEHDIVKTIILDQEYVFGEGKIDEYLKESTNQKHYPYIYINKEFVGDHRTVAYMDYQGTLINTVGLVFLVSQSSSTRHTSGEVEKVASPNDNEEETATDRYFAEKKKRENELEMNKLAAETERKSSSGGFFPSPPLIELPRAGTSGSSSSRKSTSLQDEIKKCESRSPSSSDSLESPESPSCWGFANRGSPRLKKDNCATCGEENNKRSTTDVQTQTNRDSISIESKNSRSPIFDYVS